MLAGSGQSFALCRRQVAASSPSQTGCPARLHSAPTRRFARTHRLTAASAGDGVAELEAAKAGLAQNLAAKQAEWKKEAPSSAGAPAGDAAKASLELTLVDKDSFHPALEAAGDALVVVDFYTDWCGPCKLIAPKLAQWHAELAPGVRFLKFNCNKENASLGKALGIKVAPTFHLYRHSKLLAVLTGAKEEALRELIEEHRSK